MNHSEAIEAITGVLGVTVLSYQEAIEGYLTLRGLSVADFDALLARPSSPLLHEAIEALVAMRPNVETVAAAAQVNDSMGRVVIGQTDAARHLSRDFDALLALCAAALRARATQPGASA